MSGHIDDRWFKKVKTPDGGEKKVKTARHGKGQRYRVRYIDPGGMERSQSFDRKAPAEDFLTEIQSQIRSDTYVDPVLGKMTLRTYATSWLDAQTFAATTRERVDQRLRNHVFPSLGDKTLIQISRSPSTIQAWMKGLRRPDGQPLSAGHVHAIKANLSAIFMAAVDDGRVSRNPVRAKSVKPPAIVRPKVIPWTGAEVKLAQGALPERYRVLADIGSREGLRQGEAFGLSPDDIDWLRRVVHVRRQIRIAGSKLCFAPPKGSKERDVPLTDAMAALINEHMAEFAPVSVTLPWLEPGRTPATARLLVTTTARHGLDRAYFHRLWRDARAAAAKPNERVHGFHALRHYYASAHIAGGTDIRTLSEWLGHHDPGFTLRVYGHLMPNAADKARKVIDEALDGPSDGPQTAPAFGS